MTLDSDRRERHENGHPPAAARRLPITAAHGPSHLVLQALCRTVAELAAATAEVPTRIKLQQGDTTVEVEWPDPARLPGPAGSPADPLPRPAAQRPGQPPAAPEAARHVCAPTVGTFYHAAAPEAPPFVSVGDLVRPGQPVGVLEVMKMMSTIEADITGRVVEILVPDGRPVEFQQPLIAVEPEPDER